VQQIPRQLQGISLNNLQVMPKHAVNPKNREIKKTVEEQMVWQ
jgi:hypothetical protein